VKSILNGEGALSCESVDSRCTATDAAGCIDRETVTTAGGEPIASPVLPKTTLRIRLGWISPRQEKVAL